MRSNTQRGVSVVLRQMSIDRCRRRTAAVYLAAGAVNLALAGAASAQVGDWTAGSGNWSAPGNWDNGVPTTDGTLVNILNTDAVDRTIDYDFNGAAVTLGSLNISNSGGGTNELSMTSAGLALTTTGEYIGGYPGNLGGGAGMLIQSASTNTVSIGNLDLAENAGTSGGYTLSDAGLLHVSGGASEFVGYLGAGVFNQNGGSNTLTGGGELTVGDNPGSSGSYFLSGNGVISVSSNETVGDLGPGNFNQSGGMNTVGTTLNVGVNAAGTYILSGNGTLSTRIEDIGGIGGAGTFNQSGGSNGASHVTIDYNSVYNLSAGIFVPETNEFIGSASAGTFNQSGGTHLVPGGSFLYLGYQSSGTGTYALSGSGTLTAGIEYVGYNGVANFNQSGGSHTITNNPGLIVGFDSVNHSTSSYLLSAGILSSHYESVGFETAGIFNQTGGTNVFTANGANAAELDIAAVGGSVGAYNLTGGTLAASNIYVGGAGPVISSVSGGAAGGSGTLTVGNTGNMQVTGNLKVFNSGRVNLDVPVANVGTLTLVNNGIVNLNGQLNINYHSPANDPVNTIVGYLKNGYNGGAWTGTSGIISTSAQIQGGPALSVGYADGKTDAGTAAGPNQIVVKFTLVGDADLDGTVGFTDLVTVVQNFNKGGTDWAHGNFFYGASTNFNDLVAVVQSFNKNTPPPGGQSVDLGGGSTPLVAGATIPLISSTDVQLPEPGIAASVVMMGLLASRRRRKVQWRAYDRITYR